jgi:hypothetical protein
MSSAGIDVATVHLMPLLTFQPGNSSHCDANSAPRIHGWFGSQRSQCANAVVHQHSQLRLVDLIQVAGSAWRTDPQRVQRDRKRRRMPEHRNAQRVGQSACVHVCVRSSRQLRLIDRAPIAVLVARRASSWTEVRHDAIRRLRRSVGGPDRRGLVHQLRARHVDAQSAALER